MEARRQRIVDPAFTQVPTNDIANVVQVLSDDCTLTTTAASRTHPLAHKVRMTLEFFYVETLCRVLVSGVLAL